MNGEDDFRGGNNFNLPIDLNVASKFTVALMEVKTWNIQFKSLPNCLG